MKNDNNEIKLYTKDEFQKLVDERDIERLVIIDDGIDVAIGKFKDLPDIIVDLNLKFGSKDLKVYNFIEPEDEPIITTFGMFLNKISLEDRQAIIERLNSLQKFEEEIKDYKLVDIREFVTWARSREYER